MNRSGIMKIRTDKSIKIIVKYIIIFVCVAFGSLIYASNAGLSRKLILVLLIPVCCLYYICDKHMSEKWNRYVHSGLCNRRISLLFFGIFIL